MQRVFGARIGVLLVLAFSAAASADAQDEQAEPVRPPFRQLFHAERPRRQQSGQTLDFTFGLAGAYDDNLLSGLLADGDPRVRQGGTYPTGSADIQYAARGRAVELTLSSTNTIQHYARLQGRTDHSHNALANLSGKIGSRTRVAASQTATFASFYTLLGLSGPSGGESGPVLPDAIHLQAAPQLGVVALNGWDYRTRASVVHEVGTRDSLEGQFVLARGDFAEHGSHYREVGGNYRHSFGRNTAFRGGYGHHRGPTGSVAGELVFHSVDAGVETERSLTRSGNTYFSFSSGSTFIDRGDGLDFRLLADARLVRLFRRSWSSSINYHRGLDFIGGLGYLMATNDVTGLVNGYVSPKVDMSVSGTYSRGYVSTNQNDSLRTYSAAAQLRYALSRHVAIDLRYAYFAYKFSSEFALPAELANEWGRNATSLGITVWLPALR